MFGKKKKIVEKPIHPLFGEMKYLGVGWYPAEKIELSLWSKVYEIPLCFIADTEKDIITEKQVDTFETLKNVIIEKKNEMEKAIIFYAQTDDEEELLGRLIPYNIKFSEKGECALFVEDTAEDGAYNEDGTGCAFALFLAPKIYLYPSEDSLDFLLGHVGSLGDDLYG